MNRNSRNMVDRFNNQVHNTAIPSFAARLPENAQCKPEQMAVMSARWEEALKTGRGMVQITTYAGVFSFFLGKLVSSTDLHSQLENVSGVDNGPRQGRLEYPFQFNLQYTDESSSIISP